MERHGNFDALRLAAAISVIFSHAFLLSEGTEAHEPLRYLTGQAILGLVGVFLFFVISGYLVTESFQRTASPLRFAAKRALRIYPGYAVCILLCALVLGPLVTSLPLRAYLANRGTWDFLGANLLLQVEHNSLPAVRFSTFSFGAVVNGPLWSLPCEVAMYGMVLALGSLRLLRLAALVPLFALGIACLWLDTAQSPYLIGSIGWLLSFFVAGMILKLLPRAWLGDERLALLALIGLIASVPLHGFILCFPLFGAYLVLYLALTPRLKALPAARFGDLSYGLYIYGWPVEQVLVKLSHGGLAWWQLFALALPISAALAFLSWHLVEQPWLRLKRGLAPAARAAPALRAADARGWQGATPPIP